MISKKRSMRVSTGESSALPSVSPADTELVQWRLPGAAFECHVLTALTAVGSKSLACAYVSLVISGSALEHPIFCVELVRDIYPICVP